MIDRRTFCAGVGLGLLLIARGGRTQTTQSPHRIALLEAGAASANQHFIDAFMRGMSEFGYVPGKNVVVDATSGTGGLDVTLPGGARWKKNRSSTQWTYADRSGAVAGITKAVLKDRSKTQSGLVRLTVQGKPTGLVLPPPTATRTTFVVGAANECAGLLWHPPDGTKPRCAGAGAKLSCR